MADSRRDIATLDRVATYRVPQTGRTIGLDLDLVYTAVSARTIGVDADIIIRPVDGRATIRADRDLLAPVTISRKTHDLREGDFKPTKG